MLLIIPFPIHKSWFDMLKIETMTLVIFSFIHRVRCNILDLDL